MLDVLTPDETLELIKKEFTHIAPQPETVELCAAVGRVLYEDVAATEYVPGFDRSTVDGYAVKAADTFGCSDAIPAILQVAGKVLMGEEANMILAEGQCCAVPTGGAVPQGADSVVMIEYTVRVRLGRVRDKLTASPLNRGSGVVSSFMKADGILEVPQGREGYEAGEKVSFFAAALTAPCTAADTLLSRPAAL